MFVKATLICLYIMFTHTLYGSRGSDVNVILNVTLDLARTDRQRVRVSSHVYYTAVAVINTDIYHKHE